MRTLGTGIVLAALLAALAPATTGAASALPLGRYSGQTEDGHVFELTVERSRKAGAPRKVTHFYVVYDIAGCRSGPIRQPFLASVHYGANAALRGTFSRAIMRTGDGPNQPQLRIVGRFTSPGVVTGHLRVGVTAKCPITDATPALSFRATRGG